MKSRTLKSLVKKYLPRSVKNQMLYVYERCVLGIPNSLRFRFSEYENLSPVLQFRRDGGPRKIWDSVVEPVPSTIVIFGGYLGDSAQGWLEKFPSATIHVFEPVQEYANSIQRRFHGRNVLVHPFGIASHAARRIFLGDGHSTAEIGVRPHVFRDPEGFVQRAVDFKSITIFRELFPKGAPIDVLEINIEGGEYELLPVLHSAGSLVSASNIFVQFHSIGDRTEESISSVRELLRCTHFLVWSYELQWDFWRKLSQVKA